MTRNLSVRPERIGADIEALAALTDPDRPWTRRAFTPRFLEGRAFVERAMRAAGLETRIDTAGNLIGRRPGRVPGKGALAVGSHSDTVPDGGRFDGIAGVVAGLEIARALADRGIALDHDFEVIDFLAEEVSIFGVSCVGSRGMAGVLDPGWLECGADGLTLAEGIAGVGGDPARLAEAARSDLAAFLELHIEQGPVLEAERLDVGVVTAISGITRLEVEVVGRADHAGTTPMNRRQDALARAADLVHGVERLARIVGRGEGHFVATVGEFRIEPNAANVVPSRVRMLVDIRGERRALTERFLDEFRRFIVVTATDNGFPVPSHRIVSDNPPTALAPALVGALETAAADLGLGHRRMASGAGHDAAWIARVAPSAMVFVPCRDGRSHTPEEFAETEAIALGTEVLLETVLRLDKAPAGPAEQGAPKT